MSWRREHASVAQTGNFVFEVASDHIANLAEGIGEFRSYFVEFNTEHAGCHRAVPLFPATNTDHSAQFASQPHHGGNVEAGGGDDIGLGQLEASIISKTSRVANSRNGSQSECCFSAARTGWLEFICLPVMTSVLTQFRLESRVPCPSISLPLRHRQKTTGL